MFSLPQEARQDLFKINRVLFDIHFARLMGHTQKFQHREVQRYYKKITMRTDKHRNRLPKEVINLLLWQFSDFNLSKNLI